MDSTIFELSFFSSLYLGGNRGTLYDGTDMDLPTFEKFLDGVWALPIKDERMSIEEFKEPRSVQIIIRHATLPRTFHYIIVFPSPTDGMIVRKWWTHDKDVGIETPLQGVASPDMVLAQIEQLLAA